MENETKLLSKNFFYSKPSFHYHKVIMFRWIIPESHVMHLNITHLKVSIVTISLEYAHTPARNTVCMLADICTQCLNETLLRESETSVTCSSSSCSSSPPLSGQSSDFQRLPGYPQQWPRRRSVRCLIRCVKKLKGTHNVLSESIFIKLKISNGPLNIMCSPVFLWRQHTSVLEEFPSNICITVLTVFLN